MSAISEEEKFEFKERVVGRSISEDTFDAYWLWIKRFETWTDAEPTLPILEDFDSFLDNPRRTDYPWTNATGRPAPDSYSHSSRTQAASALVMWARRQYGINVPEQPDDIVRGEPEPFDPTYLTRDVIWETIEEAPEACSCYGCRAALAVSYDAILRASELAILSVSDLNLDAGELAVTATKKSRDSTLTLGDETVTILRDYLDGREANTDRLFTNTYGGDWTKQAWSDHFRLYHHEAGSHSWGRHTPILHMLQAGSSFGDVYRRARHQNPSTTAKYARYVDADVPSWASGEGESR
jgi:integrase